MRFFWWPSQQLHSCCWMLLLIVVVVFGSLVVRVMFSFYETKEKAPAKREETHTAPSGHACACGETKVSRQHQPTTEKRDGNYVHHKEYYTT